MSIKLTPAQARALANLAADQGNLILHQLVVSGADERESDVYATPQGRSDGYRIGVRGEVSSIGETLPAGPQSR